MIFVKSFVFFWHLFCPLKVLIWHAGNICPPPNFWTKSSNFCASVVCGQCGILEITFNYCNLNLFPRTTCILVTVSGLEESGLCRSASAALQICTSWAVDHPRFCISVEFFCFLSCQLARSCSFVNVSLLVYDFSKAWSIQCKLFLSIVKCWRLSVQKKVLKAWSQTYIYYM